MQALDMSEVEARQLRANEVAGMVYYRATPFPPTDAASWLENKIAECRAALVLLTTIEEGPKVDPRTAIPFMAAELNLGRYAGDKARYGKDAAKSALDAAASHWMPELFMGARSWLTSKITECEDQLGKLRKD